MIMLKDYNFLGMGILISLRRIDFGDYLMVATRSVFLTIFIPAAISSTMKNRTLGFPTMSTRLFGYFPLA
jgi:hypothetical protein